MLSRSHRLTHSGAFQALYRRGRRWDHGLTTLHLLPRAVGDIRFGFVVGKKVGGAVQRNRVRRLLREAVRRQLPHMCRGAHGIWVARPAAAAASSAEVDRAVREVMDRARLLGAEQSMAGGDPSPHNRDHPGRPAMTPTTGS